MTLQELDTQILIHKQNKSELKLLSSFDQNFTINTITLSSPNVLMPLHLSNPRISAEASQKIRAILMPEIEAWKEELEIDIKTFENKLREVE